MSKSRIGTLFSSLYDIFNALQSKTFGPTFFSLRKSGKNTLKKLKLENQRRIQNPVKYLR